MFAYITTIALLIGLLLLMVIMLVLLVSYHDMVKKFRYSQRENTFLKNHLHERSVEILDGARKRALALLEEAEKKAAQIVASAKTYETDSEKLIKESMASLEQKEVQSLQNATAARITAYTSNLDQTAKQDINMLRDMSSRFEQQLQAELQQVDKMLQQEATSSEEIVKQTLQKAEIAAQQEITMYKTRQLQKVDEQIFTLLETVATDVLGRALPLEEHQQIVLNALESAKKDLLKN